MIEEQHIQREPSMIMEQQQQQQQPLRRRQRNTHTTRRRRRKKIMTMVPSCSPLLSLLLTMAIAILLLLLLLLLPNTCHSWVIMIPTSVSGVVKTTTTEATAMRSSRMLRSRMGIQLQQQQRQRSLPMKRHPSSSSSSSCKWTTTLLQQATSSSNNNKNDSSSSSSSREDTSLYYSSSSQQQQQEEVAFENATTTIAPSDNSNNSNLQVLEASWDTTSSSSTIANEKAGTTASSSSTTTTTTTTTPTFTTATARPPAVPRFDHVSIVLNTNARGVTNDLVQTALEVADLYKSSTSATTTSTTNTNIRVHVTTTLQEAEQAVHDILQIMANTKNDNDNDNNTSTTTTLVVPVGGDGTLTKMIDALWKQHNNNNNNNIHDNIGVTNDNKDNITPQQRTRFPVSLAYIPMGTGNALGSVVACQASTTTMTTTTMTTTTTTTTSADTKKPYGRKRRLLRRLFQPRRFKREQFRQTLQQLMDGVGVGVAGSTATENETTTFPTNNKKKIDVVELPLMQVETIRTTNDDDDDDATSSSSGDSSIDYTFFAGVGFDSLMLQDYKDIQEWSRKRAKRGNTFVGFLKDTLLGGVTGYTIALFTKTLPQCLRRQAHLMQVKVTTRSPSTTYWIDHRRGDLMRPVVEEEEEPISIPDQSSTTTSAAATSPPLLLYQGQAGIVAAGTAPFYGGGLRLFPFARMTPDDGMHLRIGRIHPVRGTLNIPAIFAGSYRDKRDDTFGCLDFCGNDFCIELLHPSGGYPVQHSGESVGTCSKVIFSTTSTTTNTNNNKRLEEEDGSNSGSSSTIPPPPIRFVTLLPPRLVVEEDNNYYY